MTDLINSLEALAGKVTPGDWTVGPYYIGNGPYEVMRGMIFADGDWPTGIICENDPPLDETLSFDLDLICLLRNALPELIAALKVAKLVRDEEWLAERISDSLDVDWRPIDCARAIIAALTDEVQ